MHSTSFLSLRLSAFCALGALSLQLQAQNSPPASGLQLWVRADAGVIANATGDVERWADQSGKSNDAIQDDDALKPRVVAGAVNGLPAIRFDGADDYLDVATAEGLDITGDIASFAVIRVQDYANFNSIWGKSSGNLPAPNDWYLIQGSGFPQFYRGDGTFAQLAQVQGERAIRTGAFVVVGVRQSGTRVTHYLNGSTNGVGDLTITPGDAATNLKIGSRDDLFTKMKGDIAELLIYGEGLTDAGVTAAMNYLRTKYGIVNDPPVVTIASPPNNTSLAAPGIINVTVNAADPDGSIARVVLLANGTAVGTATAAPYRFVLNVETAGTVVLTAVATDNVDASTASNPVTVTFTSATTPALNANPALKLWLRADAGVTAGPNGGVTRWADQSGNNNHAIQDDEGMGPVTATLNGKPALRFDGVDDYLDVADSDSLSITGDLATFVVAKFDDFAGFRAVWGKTSGNQPRPADYYLASGTGIPSFLRGFTSDEGQNVNQGVGASGRVAANTPVMLGVNQAGSTATHYLNGSPFGSGAITLTAQDLDTPLKVGARDDFATRMKGEIAELLIYDAGLSSADLANVRQYLGTKYNLPVVQLANTAPAVQITAPASGGNVTAPGPVTITATATDTDGSVTRVDFFANGLAIGSDTTSPYSASFNPRFNGPVTITAVATDNLGSRTTAAEVTVTVSGGENAPIPTGGLALWLRPDSGVTASPSGAVTAWQDSSGNNNHAAPPSEEDAPTLVAAALNGIAILSFDGQDYLEVAHSPSIAITGDVSSFFVINVDDHDTFRAVWAKTAVNLPAANDYYLLPGSGLPRFYHGNGTGSGIAQVTGAEPVPAGTFVTAGFQLEGATATHYLEGAVNGSGALGAPGGDTGSPLRIGTRADLVTRFKGGFAELLIYARALNEAERNQVESYFRSKYFGVAPPVQPLLAAARGNNNTLVFSWPAAAEGFTLEASAVVGAGASWSAVTEPVVVANGQNTVTVQAAGAARFYRLRRG